MASSQKSTSSSIAGCKHLGNNLFYYEPSANQVTSKGDHAASQPSLIVLCTWMGATLRNIGKYVLNYQRLFPTSAILVVKTAVSDFVGTWSRKSRRVRFAHARVAIRKITEKQPNGTVLLHIMSNGGCNLAVQLLLSAQEANLDISLQAMIFDCCPGFDDFGMYYRASSHSLPKGVIGRGIGRAGLYPFLATVRAGQRMGVNTRLADIRLQLNDSNLVDTHVKRLYMYSFIDPIIPWDSVRQHAAEALAKGYQVESVMFESGLHCALLMRDEAKYTNSIRDLWRDEKAVKVDAVVVDIPTVVQMSAGAMTDRGSEFSGAAVLQSKL